MHARYLRHLALIALFAFTALGAVNAVMDPWGIIGTPRWPGLSSIKPDMQDQDRIAKPWMLGRYQPDALILGNSRSLQGIPTSHPAWAGYRVFNGALTAGFLGEALDMLRYAHALHPVRRAIVNIDEGNFKRDGNTRFRYVPGRYDPDIGGAWVRTTDWLHALFTDVAFEASLRTYANRRGVTELQNSRLFHDDGSYDLPTMDKLLSLKGMSASSFEDQDREFAERYFAALDKAAQGRRPVSNEQFSGGAETLRTMLEFCRHNGIELVIYIPPFHAHFYGLMELTGAWDDIKTLRTLATQVVAQEAAANHAQPFRIVDFAGFNDISTAPVPSFKTPTVRSSWFFDSAHFRPETGAAILDRCFRPSAPPTVANFGVDLDAANLDHQLNRLQAEKTRWFDENPGAVSHLKDILAEAKRRQAADRGGAR